MTQPISCPVERCRHHIKRGVREFESESELASNGDALDARSRDITGHVLNVNGGMYM